VYEWWKEAACGTLSIATTPRLDQVQMRGKRIPVGTYPPPNDTERIRPAHLLTSPLHHQHGHLLAWQIRNLDLYRAAVTCNAIILVTLSRFHVWRILRLLLLVGACYRQEGPPEPGKIESAPACCLHRGTCTP
jgi:hypothetical protein